jgi:hypothetical protein
MPNTGGANAFEGAIPRIGASDSRHDRVLAANTARTAVHGRKE